MIIDKETFAEIAIYLKLASDAILASAKHMAVISNLQIPPENWEREWSDLIQSMMEINRQINNMERLLHAVHNANKEELKSPLLS